MQRRYDSSRPRAPSPVPPVPESPHEIIPILQRPDLGIEIASRDDDVAEILATALVGEIDFASLFRELDEPAK